MFNKDIKSSVAQLFQGKRGKKEHKCFPVNNENN